MPVAPHALHDQVDSALQAIGVLRKHWALIATGCAIGTAGGFLYGARQIPVYTATAEVAVGNDPWRSLIPGELALSSPYAERMTFETQPLVIRSTPVAERAARNLGLPVEMADSIRNSLNVANIESTRAFTLTIRQSSGEKAKAWADAIADAYIQVSTENRARTARESVRWLETQLADYESKVQKSHQALIDYIDREKLARTGTSLEQAGANAPPLIDRLRETKIQAELEAERLSARYGEKYPELQQKREEVKRLSAKIAEEEVLLRETRKKNIGYEILAGRARADLDLYSVLARKLEQASISSSLVENAITVVQYSTAPSAPSAPNRPEIVFLGSLAGLFFAIGLSFVRETFDQRITSAAQVAEVTGIPLLGSIPDVSADDIYGDKEGLSLFSASATAGSEAFRTLRANVKFALVGIEKRVLVVTSANPGEGKSMVTSNLGSALASAGLRVVIVDADLRRPTLHRYMGTRMPTRGLSTYIAGEGDDLASMLVRRGVGEADLLPAGPPPPNPGDFLAAPRLEKTLARLRESYDVVLIDSPPGTLFADAQVLAAHAGGVLLVLRSGIAERHGVKRLTSQFAQSGIKIIGCVLNGIPPSELFSYGYGYEYRRREEALESEASAPPDDVKRTTAN